MQPDKRTPAEWVEYLSREHTPVTLSEFMAGCLARLLGAQIEATQAARHTEGMVGAIDQLAEGIAQNVGLPYASSASVREALDALRTDRPRLRQVERSFAGSVEEDHG